MIINVVVDLILFISLLFFCSFIFIPFYITALTFTCAKNTYGIQWMVECTVNVLAINLTKFLMLFFKKQNIYVRILLYIIVFAAFI